MFLVRTAFWLTVVILILPAEPAKDPVPQNAATGEKLSTGQLFQAARATVDDVSTICARQPDVCSASAAAWDVFSRKAQYGAKLVIRAVSGEAPPEATAATPQRVPMKRDKEDARIPTREANSQEPATQDAPQAANQPAAQNTLTDTDRQPMWRDPRQGRPA